jgi:type IV fimbrial biogenesis protein FimT
LERLNMPPSHRQLYHRSSGGRAFAQQIVAFCKSVSSIRLPIDHPMSLSPHLNTLIQGSSSRIKGACVAAKRDGFTLIEFIVVMAIAAILVSIAIPNFRELLADSNRRAVSASLFSTLVRARSEAISRNAMTTVCPDSGDGETCGADWDKGWLLFAGNAPATNSFLLKRDAVNKALDIRATTNVRFDPAGRSMTPALTFTVCDAAGGANLKSRRITLPRTGIAFSEERGAC